MTQARDIISVNVNMFSGDLLLSCTYAPDVDPEVYARLAKKRSAYTFCPELHHLDKLGFKLCTIFRLDRVNSVTVLTKDGSPHSMQIPLMVQEAAEDVGFDKANIHYYCLEGGGLHEFSDLAVRKARHYSEIERLLPFARLDKVAEVLRGVDGCSNDQSETMLTIVDHLHEEVDEVLAALKTEDTGNLLEEIGDIMFNVAMLGRIATEQGISDLARLADRSAQKMIDKHPKVFDGRRLKY